MVELRSNHSVTGVIPGVSDNSVIGVVIAITSLPEMNLVIGAIVLALLQDWNGIPVSCT